MYACRRLALSTNNIDRIGSLAGMSKLKILSLGRNLIKKVRACTHYLPHFVKLNVISTCSFGWLSQIEKLEDVASTLEELWISYNQINSLDGLSMCTNLTTLYVSNNAIKAWNELDKLVGECVLLLPICCTCPWTIYLLGTHKLISLPIHVI
jgi:dynein light chain 1